MIDGAPAVDIRDLRFAYRAGREVLRIDALTIPRASRVFLHGPSGSGKTTLLGVIAGVLAPTAGSIHVLGQNPAELPSSRRDAFRGVYLGYLFQLFNLIPWLSVTENIALPCRLHAARAARLGDTSIDDAARQLATDLGLGDMLDTPVTELSVGQQQRVAAARALIGSPELVIADEPTSALDADRRDQFLELLFAQCTRANATLLFVSHDLALGSRFDQVLSLPDLNLAAGS
ncbi:MAG: ABC transporter ATP-binding protein [Gemmatimonadales bacterium]